MDAEKYIVAFEIGSSKITGAIATRPQRGGIVTVLGIDTEPIQGAVKRGIVLKPQEVSAKINKILKLLSNRVGGSKKITHAYVGISGQSLHIEDYTVSRDYPENTCIGEELIRRLQDEVKDMPISGTDVLEVVRTDVLIDNNLRIGNDEIVGSNLKMALKLITARKALKIGASESIPSTLSSVQYVPTALTTASVALNNEDRQLGVMLVDFGAETTTISIYKNGMLNYLSTIPLGGANITRDITSLRVTGEEAESFKIRWGSAKLTGDEADIPLVGEYASEIQSSDLAKVIKARIEEIVANVNAHFEYAKCDPKSLGAGMVIVGGASKLANLAELLAEKCDIRVRRGALRQDMLLNGPLQSRSSEYLQILGLLFCGEENCIEIEPAVVSESVDVDTPSGSTDTESFSEDKFDGDDWLEAPEEKKESEKKVRKKKGPDDEKKKRNFNPFKGLSGKVNKITEKVVDLLKEDDEPSARNLWDGEDKQQKND